MKKHRKIRGVLRRLGTSSLLSVAILFGLPTAISAQPAPGQEAAARVYRIGFVTFIPRNAAGEEVIKEELARYGYREGVNVEYRSMENERDWERTLRQTRDLLAWKPDLLIGLHTNAALAAKEVVGNANIPIVFWASDGVGEGVVASNRSPGGNITGFSFEPYNQVAVMRFVKLSLPRIACIGHLYNEAYPAAPPVMRQLEQAAALMNVRVVKRAIDREEDIEPAFAAIEKQGCPAVAIGPSALFTRYAAKLGALAQKHKMLYVGNQVLIVKNGGVASFGPPPLRRYAPAFARTVHQILTGTSPGTIPVQRDYRSFVSVNPGAAKSLGITIPDELLDEADEVIESGPVGG